MAKLTLFFNNRPIDVFHLEQDISTIGRDVANNFVIDSLAIAPSHLKISYVANEYFIEARSEQFPVLKNGQPLSREALHQGDQIQLAKHTLVYSETAPDFTLDKDSGQTTKGKTTPQAVGDGNLQIMNGADIGLVTSLNKAVTEINIADSTPAIIAKRHDGYYISRLTDSVPIEIDGTSISDETKLSNNSTVSIGKSKYLFFIE
ncbi:MAG: phosphopeptide-binding protein [Cycloclasticus sp. symbiont of Bathymodiolus heckerae]|nr:MAG: phosphopeptide-binding protein [Cycloclasticus sp. symbiont of Bathymodiolus heckerae]